MPLTVQDLAQIQATHPDYCMELVNGQVQIMSPSGYEADEVSIEVAVRLANWVHPRRCRSCCRVGRWKLLNSGPWCFEMQTF